MNSELRLVNSTTDAFTLLPNGTKTLNPHYFILLLSLSFFDTLIIVFKVILRLYEVLNWFAFCLLKRKREFSKCQVDTT